MEEEDLSWTAFGYGQQLTAISDDTNNERMRTKKRLLYQKTYYLTQSENLEILNIWQQPIESYMNTNVK